MTRKNTVSFYNQGCRLNQAETALLERNFEAQGYVIVDFSVPADVVVVNTCTVTENGDTDTRRLVNKINRLNPKAKIALVGCQAQILKDQLLKLPNVQWVVGNALKMNLSTYVNETTAESAPLVAVPKIEKGAFTIQEVGIDTHHTRANLKIQDGCDFYCSFCVIPFARGPARSRDFDNILSEAHHLTQAGHQELILTGINIGTYENQEKSLLDVVTALETLPKLKRLRISSIEPTTIPMNLIKKMAHSEVLCNYLHLPIQSGSDTLLKAMARKYTLTEYKQFFEDVYGLVPNIAIGTDVIVGFPGETDTLFDETEATMRELPFAYFHVFSYSERKFARSHKLEGQVAPPTIAKRSAILRALSERKRQVFYSHSLGTTQKVLFEQKKKGVWIGLTENFIRVQVQSDHDLTNRIVEVHLQNILSHAVEGRL